jgi:exosortase/archaeosortase family protein
MGIFALCGFGATFTFGLLYRGYSGVSLPSSFVMTYSFAGIVLSSALLFSEKRADGSALGTRERIGFVGLMLFPALIWIISAPLMSAVETKVSVFLLNRVTSVVFAIFDSLGMAIERRANVLILPKGEVGVQEACSGIRSLTGCLFAGSFLAAVFLDRLWKKVLMVLTALILAFLTNIMRSMFLTAWAYAYGSEAIEGTVHDATGYAVLGLTVVLLLCLMPLFNFKLPQPPSYPAPACAKDEPGEARTEENK